jgi:hypothetical protein
MSILKTIEKERWATDYPTCKLIEGHNDCLDRIAEAAKQPRVMKLWADDCKPEKSGWYWYQKKTWKTPLPMYYNHNLWFESLAGFESSDENPDDWLELESTPVLPDGKQKQEKQ